MARVFYGTQHRRNNLDRKGGARSTNPRRHVDRDPANVPRFLIPPEYFELTRKHFLLLKCYHHQSALEKGFPPSLAKKIDLLSAEVNPAFKNEAFRVRMRSIRDEWCGSVKQTLKEHYAERITETISFITSNGMPSDLLDRSLQIVVRWGRKQLGKRLTDEVLDKAISSINKSQLLLDPEFPVHADPAPVPNPESLTGSFPRNGFIFRPFPNPPTSDLVPSSVLLKEVYDKDTQTDSVVDSGVVEALTLTDVDGVLESSTRTEVFSEALAPSVLPVVDNIPQARAPSVNDIVLDTASATTSTPEDISTIPSTGALVQTRIVNMNTVTSTGSTDRFNLDLTKSRLVLGDTNLKDLRLEDSSVFSTEKGRLSFFKTYLQSSRGVHEGVSDVVICLSSLDEKNKPNTNFTTFRSVLYNTKRLFPNAKVSVVLNCIPLSSEESVRRDLKEFNQMIVNRLVSLCDVVQLPDTFTVKGNLWNASERDVVYKAIKDFLVTL